MGVVPFVDQIASAVPPARLFKALLLDGDNLLPKLMPQAIKSVDIIQGDGGAGTIKQLNFAEGRQFRYAKHRIDEIDEQNFVCKYTVIEGDALGDKLESVSFHIKLEADANGGCIFKTTSNYYTKEGIEIKEEDIKAGKEKSMVLYKVVEDYLLANPDAYA